MNALRHAGEAEHTIQLRRRPGPMGLDALASGSPNRGSHGPGDDQCIVEMADHGQEIRYKVDRDQQVGDSHTNRHLRPARHERISQHTAQHPDARPDQPGQFDQRLPRSAHSECRTGRSDEQARRHEPDDAQPAHGTHPALATASPWDEGGSATLWVLGLCLLLLGLGGISIDVWRGFADRRALASAVDAAAVAGTSGIDEQAVRNGKGIRLDATRARQLAVASLARQTEVPIETVDVTVVGDAITVTAHTHVDLGLTRILMAGAPLDVQASSTAHPRRGT